jgi:hypothetical protein
VPGGVQRVEDTLLVVESFKSDGVEYLAGDRVPTRHRAIRRIAAQRPDFFAMEWSTEPLDLEWLASIEAEGRYEAVEHLREGRRTAGSVPCAGSSSHRIAANRSSSAALRGKRPDAAGEREEAQRTSGDPAGNQDSSTRLRRKASAKAQGLGPPYRFG